jgi:uncharacterized protein (DUF1810 family)
LGYAGFISRDSAWSSRYEDGLAARVMIFGLRSAKRHDADHMTDDPHRLQRFVDAQNDANTYERALSELRAGHKRSHWMWFVFPQISGLGHSPMAVGYAISSLAEASAYLDHPLLGPRLLDCTRALARITGSSAHEILGATDALKLRSSMTLFAHAAPHEPLFRAVLGQYFDGMPDAATEQLLRATPKAP